jgi:hypothetical protein
MIGSLLCFVIIVLIANSEAAWHMVWRDEFNGNSLNETNWKYEERGNTFGQYFRYSGIAINHKQNNILY